MLGLAGMLHYQGTVSDTPAAAIADLFWQNRVCDEYSPLPGITIDNNDCWDLDSNLDFAPTPSPVAEGYWTVDSNDDLTPVSVSCV
jgi:hypothetical protein